MISHGHSLPNTFKIALTIVNWHVPKIVSGLVALAVGICVFGRKSGVHFNPAVI